MLFCICFTLIYFKKIIIWMIFIYFWLANLYWFIGVRPMFYREKLWGFNRYFLWKFWKDWNGEIGKMECYFVGNFLDSYMIERELKREWKNFIEGKFLGLIFLYKGWVWGCERGENRERIDRGLGREKEWKGDFDTNCESNDVCPDPRKQAVLRT